MLPRIFIGGTGRSGTSVIYRSLGCHEQIFAFPQEMRFLVDPHGLMDLIDALTIRYSPVLAREALYEFERLMRVYLTVPQRPPYFGFNLAQWINEEYYYQRLDQFCTQLTEFEYIGHHWQVETDSEGRLVDYARRIQSLSRRLLRKPDVPFKLALPRNKMKAVRYFPDRQVLIRLAATFVDDVFLYPARNQGKKTWCEKTPQNIFHLNFLNELFPESVFIQIKRDPRGVAYSMIKESWKRAPGDVRKVCLLLKNLYEAWFEVKETVDFSKLQYFEFKIEDIAASPEDSLENIAFSCGLEGGFYNLPDISLSRVNAWHEDMSDREIKIVEQVLGNYIKGMGYDH